MDPERYAEQLKWRNNILEKAEQKKAEERDALNTLSFNPTFESKDPSDIKKFSGPAAELTNKSGNMHIERQIKARKEKQIKEDKVGWKANRVKTSPTKLAKDGKYLTFAGSPSRLMRGDDNQNNSFDTENDEDPNRELTYEETLVETLEKERREWHAERVNLIHCVYLQQMELAERAVAAQDKAAKIAKEFGEAIAIFEQRIDTIESNVEKEIKAVKDIAENLLKAISNSSMAAEFGVLSTHNVSQRTV